MFMPSRRDICWSKHASWLCSRVRSTAPEVALGRAQPDLLHGELVDHVVVVGDAGLERHLVFPRGHVDGVGELLRLEAERAVLLVHGAALALVAAVQKI